MQRELGQQGRIIKPIAVETVPGEAIKGGLGASSREKDMMQCDPELICLEIRMGLG